MNKLVPCVLGAVMLSGCFFSSDNGGGGGAPPPDTGTVVFDWTVDSSTDPAQCTQGGADTFDVVITTTSGANVGEWTQACDAFSTSVDLSPGRYEANAVLLDGSGRERTTQIAVNPFTIVGGDQLTIPVDFPASSFY